MRLLWSTCNWIKESNAWLCSYKRDIENWAIQFPKVKSMFLFLSNIGDGTGLIEMENMQQNHTSALTFKQGESRHRYQYYPLQAMPRISWVVNRPSANCILRWNVLFSGSTKQFLEIKTADKNIKLFALFVSTAKM